MIVTTISEEIRLRYSREQVPAKISNGTITYLHEGNWISESEYKRLYPVPVLRMANYKGENKCKRANFVNDIKSY